MNHPTIEDSVAAIKGYIDGGFRSAKLGLGKRGLSKAGRDPDYDVALVGALREAIGPTPDIMVDAGNGVHWDVETAITTTRRMEEFAIKWIEEPLHPSNVAGHQALKAQTQTLDRGRRARVGSCPAIGAGSKAAPSTSSASIRRASRASPASARSRSASTRAGKIVNAHAWSTAVLTAASLHLSLASPAAILFELKPIPGPMQFDLVDEPFWHEGGLVRAPNRPGHGAEPRTAILEKYRA